MFKNVLRAIFNNRVRLPYTVARPSIVARKPDGLQTRKLAPKPDVVLVRITARRMHAVGTTRQQYNIIYYRPEIVFIS